MPKLLVLERDIVSSISFAEESRFTGRFHHAFVSFSYQILEQIINGGVKTVHAFTIDWCDDGEKVEH